MFAVVFPGQGSQKPGMGKELAEAYAEAREVFDGVEAATGVPIAKIAWESEDATLRQTENAQLALFTTGLAAFRALQARLGQVPVATAGHSVGEYAALVAAGHLSLEDGARLVQRRGELMRDSGTKRPGTMAAVLGMDRAALEALCAEVSNDGQVVVVANDNCPGQLVISGDVDAVQRASALAPERGARRVLPLNVSGAFHSPLMVESARAMGDSLRAVTFSPSSGPKVYSNVTAEPVTNPELWPGMLEKQLENPVLWDGSMRAMIRDGMSTFVECGHGEVLCGLLKRIDAEKTGLRVTDPVTLDETAASLQGAS